MARRLRAGKPPDGQQRQQMPENPVGLHMIQGAGVMGVDHHRGHAAVLRRQGIPEGIHGVVGMDMEHVAGMLPQGPLSVRRISGIA